MSSPSGLTQLCNCSSIEIALLKQVTNNLDYKLLLPIYAPTREMGLDLETTISNAGDLVERYLGIPHWLHSEALKSHMKLIPHARFKVRSQLLVMGKDTKLPFWQQLLFLARQI